MYVEFHPPDDNGNFIRLAKPMKIRGLTIPKGFESDGASVPPYLYSIVFPPVGKEVARASVAHDYVYREHPKGWTKEQADKMFYDLLIEDGCNPYKALMAYNGVKLFGAPSWHQHDDKDTDR